MNVPHDPSQIQSLDFIRSEIEQSIQSSESRADRTTKLIEHLLELCERWQGFASSRVLKLSTLGSNDLVSSIEISLGLLVDTLSEQPASLLEMGRKLADPVKQIRASRSLDEMEMGMRQLIDALQNFAADFRETSGR